MAERRLQIFRAVVEHQSFSRAAEALFMSQPAVTTQVRQLEDYFGLRLLDRGHGRLALTPAGEVVMHYARQVLPLLEEMESRLWELAGEMRGGFVLGASSFLAAHLLPELLVDFTALHPQLRIRLEVGDSDQLEAGVLGRTLHAAMIERPPEAPLVSVRCCDSELRAICAPGHPLADLRQVTPSQLCDYEYIARAPGSAVRRQGEAWFAQAGILPEGLKTLIELGSSQALLSAVRSGLGFSIVPASCVADEVACGQLVSIALEPAMRRSVHLVYPEERYLPRRVAAFIAFVREKLQEREA